MEGMKTINVPKIQRFRLGDIKPASYNPKIISDEALGGLTNSLERFGCVDLIVVNIRDDKNTIVGGHQRYKVLIKKCGPDAEFDCSTVDLGDEDERLLNLALSNPHIQGEFIDGLPQYIDELRQQLTNQQDYFDLQIDKLREEIADDLGGRITPDEARKSLAERFIIPPFSTLDARQGYWQERKQTWLGLGIRSELGGRDKLKTTGSLSGSVPHYYEYKRQAEAKIGRELTCSEFEEKYLDSYIPKNSQLAYTETGGVLSIFDPVLSEIAYRWFCPANAHILDPFAGGSVRGIVAAFLGYKYTGIDLRPEQITANEEQAKAIVPDNVPRWITGDSREVVPALQEQFDFIFSCPPYGDLEIYSDDPRDLSNMDYDEFLGAYAKVVHSSVKLLKDNRFACYVVGDIRGKDGFYRDFVSSTIGAFESAGARLYNEAILITAIGSLPIRVGKQFQSGRKLGKAHQNVLVFYKGDPKAIKNDFGDVEIGDVE